MRYIIIFLIILTGCTINEKSTREKLTLAGEWKFRIDSLDTGIDNKWYDDDLPETVKLPGSMAQNNKGCEVTVNTDWTGDIVDRSYFTEGKYEKYRQPGNIKIPFWLKPVKYYKGVAWYQKEFDLPAEFSGKRTILFLERCHWESSVFVNGVAAGSRDGLATPHEYDITSLVKSGKNRLSIRIDNRIIIPIGVNSHSITDHTQTDWNGITGEISLRSIPVVSISGIKIFPEIKNKEAKVIITVSNNTGGDFEGKMEIRAEGYNQKPGRRIKRKKLKIQSGADRSEVIVHYPMGNRFKLWSEFTPNLYSLIVRIKDLNGKIADSQSSLFGMREFKANGTRFEVNGTPIFLRGTTECCIFPLTGYPPCDTGSWKRVLRTCREYGLNHIRFHSYCPPGAAFTAADELGFYFHVECSSWANQGSMVGDGGPTDRFIYEEGDRILKEYGNHPSFCMLAYGNEPAGKNQNEFLGQLIRYWKSLDDRRVYTSAAGWPIIPDNDYNLTPEPRIQHWGEGLKSIINREAPQTMFDYRDFVSGYKVPTISHEIGQWCVYPDFRETDQYTGVLKPTNFEIFRETLEENNMGNQAGDFLKASGRLQVLCYKADIEATLRTPGFGGFEILQLHDFPGQGTALVGVLNAFFRPKGYVTPEEFRMFCNQTVPLARMKKFVFLDNEKFSADIEVAHFGPAPIENAEFICQIKDSDGKTIFEKVLQPGNVPIGNGISAGRCETDLSPVEHAQKFTFEVLLNGTSYKNKWDFWIYPAKQEPESGNVMITDNLNSETKRYLDNGGSVLLLPYGKIGKNKGADVAIGFSSIFWNTAWTNNQAPHTLGILCDPGNPVFKDFPTEYHSNLQWWDPVSHSQVMIINNFPAELRPLIQPIDTWFENRRLALAFEARISKGKILVCSIDLRDSLNDRPVSRQLYSSILNYMNSGSFNPGISISQSLIENLLK
jgi:hypothetical protein